MTKTEFLNYIQRTNPQMTEEKLLEELSKSRYSATALYMICENTSHSCNNSEYAV